MPLTSSGSKVLENFQKQYGSKQGKSYFYASINKGTLPEGKMHKDAQHRYLDACRRGDAGAMKTACDQMMRGRLVR